MSERLILDAEAMRRTLWRLANEIVERTDAATEIVLIGVRRRGVHLAARLASLLAEIDGGRPDVIALDTTPFRDDRPRRERPPSIPGEVSGRPVVIVDDVLFPGRTARAAMEAVLAAGRPSVIRLLVLVDRGHRELPIRPDFVGKNVPTSPADAVEVHVTEEDGLDDVVLVAQNSGDVGS